MPEADINLIRKTFGGSAMCYVFTGRLNGRAVGWEPHRVSVASIARGKTSSGSEA
jgi:hypothetical protein